MASRSVHPRRAATRSKQVNDENAVPTQAAPRAKAGAFSNLGLAQKVSVAPKPVGKSVPLAVAKTGTKRSVLGVITSNKDELEDERRPTKPRAVEPRQPLATQVQVTQNRQIAPVPHRVKSSVYSAVPEKSVIYEEEDPAQSRMDLDRRSARAELSPEIALNYDGEQVDLSDAEDDEEDEEEEEEEDFDDENWIRLSDEEELRCQQELKTVRDGFQDTRDPLDITMETEYIDDIFSHMEELELSVMPNPRYMEFQTEIEWTMRTTLIDWLLQVHLRYHMLPETLWIAVNLVDRFLSVRVVSLIKLQLVGVTAMFIAAKYEEILAPSVDEFVFMTENGYSKDEILKGERIILQTLDFTVSSYCSPYSWIRRISKADDYDIQTRTLCKFLMEVTLLDHRFLRCKPSMIAAIGMYLSRKMLEGDWNDAFVYHSNFTEAQLVAGAMLICDRLVEPDFESVYVFKKYANRKFLRAATFARNWAQNNAATAWSRCTFQ